MDVDQIFSWILAHPKNYPGKHQESQPRTIPSFKPLAPQAQLHIIFKGTAEYIRENLLAGKSVNMRGFGAFSFEVHSDAKQPAMFTTQDFRKELHDQRAERKHIHSTRPCFVVDQKVKYLLTRYPGKEEITTTKSQHSIYQQGFGMIFCNAGPISAGCYLAKEVVASAHEAFIKAVGDLTKLGQSLNIDFGFCKVRICDKDLSYSYKADFVNNLNHTSFENKMRKSDLPTPDFWRTTMKQKWMTSTLSTMLKQPDSSKVQTLTEKTLALKIMSLDLNTAERTEHSSTRAKNGSLPPITTIKH
jgi:nucleoid DNA-binding protein